MGAVASFTIRNLTHLRATYNVTANWTPRNPQFNHVTLEFRWGNTTTRVDAAPGLAVAVGAHVLAASPLEVGVFPGQPGQTMAVAVDEPISLSLTGRAC